MSATHEKKETPLSDVKVVPIDESHADPNRYHHETSDVIKIGETLAYGQIPPNQVITTEIDHVTAYLKDREYAQDTTGGEAKILRDVRELVETARETLLTKNRDNLAQRFFTNVANIAVKAKADATGAVPPTDMIVQIAKFLLAAKSVFVGAAKSPNFRQALQDLSHIVRDVYHRLDASKVQSTIENPNASVVDVAAAVKDTAVDFKNTNKAEGAPESQNDLRRDVKSLLQELSQHPEAHEAFNALLSLWNMLTAQFYTILDGAVNDPDVKQALGEAREIMEAYAGKNLDNFLLRVRCVVGLIALDTDLQNYLKECQEYLKKALDNPALIAEDSYYNEGGRLYNEAGKFVDKYQKEDDIAALIVESLQLANSIGKDKQIKKLEDKASQIVKDSTTTGLDGEPHLDADLVTLLRKELVPFLSDRIKEVPVPGFQIVSEDFEYLIVDDIFLQMENFFPDRIKISSAESAELKINQDDPLKTRAYVDIKVDGVSLKIKDFYFSFKRKTPVGDVSDEGRANLKVTGDGLHIHIRYEMAIDAKTNVPMLQDAKVEINLANVDVDIIEAQNKILLNMATTLFKARLQKDVQDTIKIKIEELGQDLAAALNKQVVSNISPTGMVGFLKTNLVLV